MSSHSRRRLSLNPLRHGVVVALLCFCGLGVAQAQTVFWSNLDGAATTSAGSSYINRRLSDVAQSFTTGGTATTLNSITLLIDSINSASSLFSVSLSLYTSGSSLPGTLIETLSNSSATAIGSNIYNSAGSTVLVANTTYWWVASVNFDAGSAAYTFSMTSATSGQTPDNWAIGNAYVSSSYAPGRVSPTWASYSARVFKFELDATPVAAAVPEPATTVALAGLVALGVVACHRRRR